MTYDLDAVAAQITKQITNILNNDQNYKPVKFEHVLLFVRAMGNVKPPQDDDVDKFIQRTIDTIPRVPKTMTLDYLTAQLRERASQGAKGMFSMVSLYPFVVSDLNRVKFTLNADKICEKLKNMNIVVHPDRHSSTNIRWMIWRKFSIFCLNRELSTNTR